MAFENKRYPARFLNWKEFERLIDQYKLIIGRNNKPTVNGFLSFYQRTYINLRRRYDELKPENFVFPDGIQTKIKIKEWKVIEELIQDFVENTYPEERYLANFIRLHRDTYINFESRYHSLKPKDFKFPKGLPE